MLSMNYVCHVYILVLRTLFYQEHPLFFLYKKLNFGTCAVIEIKGTLNRAAVIVSSCYFKSAVFRKDVENSGEMKGGYNWMGPEVMADDFLVKKKRSRREIKELTSTTEELTEGVLPEKQERNKRELEDHKLGESVNMCMSHGLISVIGRRRVMEDAVKVSFGEITGYDFFAVFDGHGAAEVANSCRDKMHRLLVKGVEEWTCGGKKLEWEKVMEACFAKMEEEVMSSGGDDVEEDAVLKTMGSTALVMLVGKEELVVTKCGGDSRAILCRGGNAEALPCGDDKREKPDERERGDDQYLMPYLTSKPEVSVTERTNSDTFVVLGSDGLWDVVSNEIACQVVKLYLDGEIKMRLSDLPGGGCSGDRAAEAAAMLAELAIARGSTDNISVIVVELKK